MTKEQLRERREALEMTQEELGAVLTVTENTVARWERGERPIRHPGMLDLALEALERRPRPDTPESVDRKARAAGARLDQLLGQLAGPRATR